MNKIEITSTILERYTEEMFQPLLDDGYRPYDAFRLRLHNLVQPKDLLKLSDEDHVIKGLPYFYLYSLIREIKPDLIIETGVQNGCSTEIILSAIKKNLTGRLISFDIGPEQSESSHRTWDGIPGKYVRQELKDAWTLVVGDSKKTLPAFLKDNKQNISLFHHDSCHTSEHIEFEIDEILPHMKSGDILCMHDREGRTFKQEKSGQILRILEKDAFTIWVKQ